VYEYYPDNEGAQAAVGYASPHEQPPPGYASEQQLQQHRPPPASSLQAEHRKSIGEFLELEQLASKLGVAPAQAAPMTEQEQFMASLEHVRQGGVPASVGQQSQGQQQQQYQQQQHQQYQPQQQPQQQQLQDSSAERLLAQMQSMELSLSQPQQHR
jgi:hypothetical protein